MPQSLPGALALLFNIKTAFETERKSEGGFRIFSGLVHWILSAGLRERTDKADYAL
jgi:hypothetical protein